METIPLVKGDVRLPDKPSFEETPKRILLIDDDPNLHDVIAKPLKDVFPYVKFKYCVSGEEAWEEAKKEPYDLIISDWMLGSKLSGLALINRFRFDEYYRHVPILIISGYLNDADFSLMSEFNYTSQLLKPFRAQLLVRAVKDLFSEAKWFLNQQDLIANLMANVDRKNAEGEKKAVEELVGQCPRPIPTLLLCSEMYRKQDRPEEALHFCQMALDMNPEDFGVECEIGKVYLQLGKIQEAQKYLEASFKRSPENLDRICDLGRLHLEELDTENAKKFFETALSIDDQNEKALQGMDMSEKLDEFFRHNNPTSIPNSFAGLLNAIGIGMVRRGEFKEGIEHYESALNYINDKQVKAYVCFNVGLGYIRHAKLSEAEQWLSRSLNLKPGYEKSIIYLEKVKKALGASEPLFREDNSESEFIDEQITTMVG